VREARLVPVVDFKGRKSKDAVPAVEACLLMQQRRRPQMEAKKVDEPRNADAGGCDSPARRPSIVTWSSARSKPRWRLPPRSSMAARSTSRARSTARRGDYETFRRWLVVPDSAGLQNPDAEELLSEAGAHPDIEEGDYIEEAIESLTIGRIGAQAAKQVILQKIRDAEREQLLQRLPGARREDLRRHRQAPRQGRRHRRVRARSKAPAPLRDDPQGEPAHRRPGAAPTSGESTRRCAGRRSFCRAAPARLHDRALPAGGAEIEQRPARDQVVRRDPGSRAKIAVRLARPSRRPDRHLRRRPRLARQRRHQRARRRARRHRALVEDSGAVRDRRAGACNVQSIVVDEERHAMDVVVDEENLAIAIGRGGQNVRLASELTGWRINIMTAEESQAKQAGESESVRALFRRQARRRRRSGGHPDR
jgi:N utilization substance protein A